MKERLEKLGHKIDDIGEGKGFYCKICDMQFFLIGNGVAWIFDSRDGVCEGSIVNLPTCNEMIIKSIIE